MDKCSTLLLWIFFFAAAKPQHINQHRNKQQLNPHRKKKGISKAKCNHFDLSSQFLNDHVCYFFYLKVTSYR